MSRHRNFAILGLVLAACTSGPTATSPPAPSSAAVSTTAGIGSQPPSTPNATAPPVTTTAPASPTTTPSTINPEPESLLVGALLPITGREAAFGPAMAAAVRVAVGDINAAGGVLGSDVELLEADGGDVDSGLAVTAVGGLIDAGAHVIIGALSSAVSELVIDETVQAGVIQFSPSNSSPVFTDHPDQGLYFRTTASDALEGRMLAQLLSDRGLLPTAVVYRDDAYGRAIAGEFEDAMSSLGAELTASRPYDPSESAAAIVSDIDTSAAIVVVIGLEETADIVVEMATSGIGPADRSVWVIEPAFQRLGDLVDDPSVLSGLRGVARASQQGIETGLSESMADAWGEPIEIQAYAAQTYDAVVITALATEAGGSLDPVTIASEIPDVTRSGDPCTTFDECLALIAAGADIEYVGLGGPYRLSDIGEPTTASYEIVVYTGDVDPEVEQVVQAS